MGEHQIILLGALLSDPPAAANGVVDIFPLVLIAPVYGDQNERLDDLERATEYSAMIWSMWRHP